MPATAVDLYGLHTAVKDAIAEMERLRTCLRKVARNRDCMCGSKTGPGQTYSYIEDDTFPHTDDGRCPCVLAAKALGLEIKRSAQ